jgi:crotonobetainyl-CoA:carnitine CoA-transferase CaiB-like acyl-CoA transferase
MNTAFTQLLESIKLKPNADVHITDNGEPIASRFFIGQAAATALAACGNAANSIWQERGGKPQQVQVDTRGAAVSLLSFACQRLDDNSQPERDPNRPLVGFYQTQDGRWLHLHGAFPKLAAGTLEVLQCAADRDSIKTAVAQWHAQELEDALAAAGMCGAMARTREEWLAHPQGIALQDVPAIVIDKIGDSAAMPLPDASRPLSNINVLDLTRVLAGPTCARTLASHGANVLKINSPNLPSVPPFVMDTGHGKRSAFLDLEQASDQATLHDLIQSTDVFSQGYRKGAMDKRGLSADALAAARPGIIYVSINAYGHVGPWAQRPGWEQLAQTASGVAMDEGNTDKPQLIAAAATDYTTGYLAACGVMAALHQRALYGGSYHVQVSLAQTANWLYSFGFNTQNSAAADFGPQLVAPYMTSSMSGFGKLHHLGPILTMSETPPRWEQVTVPLGSHAASW